MKKIAVVFLVILFTCLFYKGYASLEDCNKEKEKLASQIDKEVEHGKELDKTCKEYGTDEYVEKYARSLGLVKPNEKVYRNYYDKK